MLTKNLNNSKWVSSIALVNPLITLLVVETYRASIAIAVTSAIDCLLKYTSNIVAYNSHDTHKCEANVRLLRLIKRLAESNLTRINSSSF